VIAKARSARKFRLSAYFEWNDHCPRPPNPTNTGRIGAALLSLGTTSPSLGTSILQPSALLAFAQLGSFNMNRKTAVEVVSRRRMLGILGAGVAFGMGTPAAVLTASDAEAQTPEWSSARTDTTIVLNGVKTGAPIAREDVRSGASDRTNRRVARRKARKERAWRGRKGARSGVWRGALAQGQAPKEPALQTQGPRGTGTHRPSAGAAMRCFADALPSSGT